uniref:Uncharacterized protein n=1 Tax=Mucochytrium quahogii TaxID=96639 RepID=A0A7S2S2Q7_9STRA|mmetsp:Transcript_3537/g.5122  ORF Transcript_3537/g.5122 Transcript_3537/m.5122 type:complete len:458 (-) Transcript_3537:50-1423(-)
MGKKAKKANKKKDSGGSKQQKANGEGKGTENIQQAGKEAILDRHLQTRPEKDELKAAGVTKGKVVDNSIAGRHVELEKKLAGDQVNKKLDCRPDHTDLTKSGIMQNADDVAPAIQGRVATLDKKVRRNSVKASLEKRPDADQMQKHGVLKDTKLASSLQPRASALEKNIRRSSLKGALLTRPDQRELEQSGLLSSEKVSDTLQGTAETLKKKIAKDQVAHKLGKRPDLDSLKKAGVHGGLDVAPSIQERRASLSRKMNADQVSHLLESRPEADELKKSGVLNPGGGIADGISGKQLELGHQMTKAKVSRALRGRPEVGKLLASNIIPDEHVAPALVKPTAQLEKNIRRDSLKKELSQRLDRGVLVEKGIIQEAPSNEKVNQAASLDHLKRTRYAIALKGAVHLEKLGLVDASGKGALKDLIFAEDKRIMAAVEVFELDHDLNEMLDTLHRIALSTLE